MGNQRYLKIVITPNRNVNRYDIFANEKLTITNLKANGVKAIDLKSNIISQKSEKLLSYYVIDNIPLSLEFTIPTNQKLNMNLVESSFDLMTNPMFRMTKRRNWMIPTPFVLTDAVVIKENMIASSKVADENPIKVRRTTIRRDSVTVAKDSLR